MNTFMITQRVLTPGSSAACGIAADCVDVAAKARARCQERRRNAGADRDQNRHRDAVGDKEAAAREPECGLPTA